MNCYALESCPHWYLDECNVNLSSRLQSNLTIIINSLSVFYKVPQSEKWISLNWSYSTIPPFGHTNLGWCAMHVTRFLILYILNQQGSRKSHSLPCCVNKLNLSLYITNYVLYHFIKMTRFSTVDFKGTVSQK